MGNRLKLKLVFDDRMGIVADVAAIIAQKGLNIISMEVQKYEDLAFAYLEAKKPDGEIDPPDLYASLKRIPNCKELTQIHTLPQEKREEGYKVVLDSVSDGILSIDENGTIITINNVARKILDCEKRDVIGKPIDLLLLPDTGLREAQSQNRYGSEKRNIITDKGRFTYIATCKPIKNTSGRIVGAVEIMKDTKEIEALAHAVCEPSQVTFSDIVGVSESLKQVISLAQKISKTDAIVSLRGQSGTGKELFARAIHFESQRSGPFIPINCAALPENLLESELFGYEGGSFTGARRQGKAGLFEMAKDGTVFMDEIGEMSQNVQAKILRLIQEKRVRRIGGSSESNINARLITATNRNLERLVEERQFREDLYYRINVLPIHLPPLRNHGEDIPVLANHFLFQLSSKLTKKPQSLHPAAMEKLLHHDWPGNIRELKNVIERAAILCNTDVITKDCILFSFELSKNFSRMNPVEKGLPEGRSLKALVEGYERELLSQIMKQSPSIRKTANRLKISHTTLLNKLKKHGIEPYN